MFVQVDVYSFGVVLWELWTGREPFACFNYHALLHKLTQEPGLRPALPGTALQQTYLTVACQAHIVAEDWSWLPFTANLCPSLPMAMLVKLHRYSVKGSQAQIFCHKVGLAGDVKTCCYSAGLPRIYNSISACIPASSHRWISVVGPGMGILMELACIFSEELQHLLALCDGD
jgi:Protein tyrosine and serine/threonine kinase